MTDKNKHITYSLADIERYVQGKMNAAEMHAIERAALQDAFLADAIEGYSNSNIPLSKKHLANIAFSLQNNNTETAVIAMPQKKNFAWRIAASIILLLAIGSAGYFILNKKSNDVSLAKKESGAVKTIGDSAKSTMQQAAPILADTAHFADKNEDALALNKPNNNQNKNAKSAAKEEAPTHEKIPSPAFAKSKKKDDNLPAGEGYAMAMRAPATTLSGNVVDDEQNPVANATIVLSDSTKIITGKEGNYTLQTADSAVTASVSAFGYKPLANVKISAANSHIFLQEKPFVLSDVEVVNIGEAHKKALDTAVIKPEGGWQSFQEYVYKKLNKKYDSASISNASINGELQLEFSIDEAGKAFDFKIIQAQNNQLAADAITAIKQGPKWIGLYKLKGTRVRVKY